MEKFVLSDRVRATSWTASLTVAILLLVMAGLRSPNGHVSAQSVATWYVATNGANATTCGSSSSPCATAQYVVDNKVNGGDTIIINPGTYSGGISLSNASRHSNITITTTSAVKTALGVFNRGIPSGTDNRPLLSGGRLNINSGVTGVTAEYLRIRVSATPQNGWGTWAVGIYEPGNTVRNCELWNGTGIAIFTIGPLTLTQNYLHDSGTNLGSPSGGDTHTLFVDRDPSIQGVVSRPNATSWAQKILIEDTTFGGQSDGDQIQFSTGDFGFGKDNYIEISRVDFNAKVDEQMIDSKGSDYVSVHDSNFLSQTGIEGSDLSQSIDFVSSDLSSNHWWIYNNVFRPAGPEGQQVINTSHASGEDYFWIWNNVFYSTQKTAWPTGDQRSVGTWNGMPSHMTFVHNTVLNEAVTATCNFAFVSSERSDSVIRNNLFYNVFQTSGDSGAIFTGRGNAAVVSNNYFNVAGCPSGQCTNGTNAVINATNPIIDAVNGNYMLQAGASVIGKGYVGLVDDGLFTPSLDKNGVPRGTAPDVGAYQHGGGPRPPTNLRIVR